jgi:transposase
MSNKTFQYRIYPTKNQETILTRWLGLCCETYNAALQERRDAATPPLSQTLLNKRAVKLA